VGNLLSLQIKIKYNRDKAMIPPPYIKYSVKSSDGINGMDNHPLPLLSIDKNLVFGNFNIAFSLFDNQLSGKWLLQLDSTETLGYFAFMLNDPMTLKRIFGLNIARGKKFRVTKSMISSLHIPMGDLSLIRYYSLIEEYFQQMYYVDDKDDISLLKLDIFSSIRLALSFELHQYKLLQNLKIYIFSNWKDLVDEVGNDINALFENLLTPDNVLLNNVRRFQLLLNSFRKASQDGLASE